MTKNKLLFFLPAMFIFLFSKPVLAGEINADEQEVIAAASGTFEADGVIYRARPEYLAQLISYLSQDDVDLTTDTCQAAIREMYANVGTGIEEGYIYAVEDETAGTVEAEGGPVSGETVPAEEAETVDSLSGEQPKKASPGREQIKETAPDKEQMKKTDSAVPTIPKIFRILDKLDMDNDSSAADGNKELFEALEAGRITGFMTFRILLSGEMICLAFLVLILIISVGKHLFGHYRRRRMKKVLCMLLCITTACSVMVLCELVTFRFGLLSHEGALKQIQKTSFYETVDEELQMNAALAMAAMEIPTELMDGVFYGDRIVVAARQQTESLLKGDGYIADSSSVIDPLRTAVTDYLAERYPDSDFVAEGAGKLMGRLERDYEDSLQWAGVEWWNREKECFRSFVKIALPAALVLFICSVLLLAGLCRYRWRAVRLAGYGILSGNTVHLVCIMMMRRTVREIIPQLQPVYMREYMVGSVESAVFTGLLCGGIGLCTALLWLYAAGSLKNGE